MSSNYRNTNGGSESGSDGSSNDHLYDALRRIGQDILSEAVPERLHDVLSKPVTSRKDRDERLSPNHPRDRIGRKKSKP